LPAATSSVHATTRRDGDDNVTTITLSVPESSKVVALFQHLSIRKAAGGDAALPILWSDNDVTLWPGESLTVTARYAAKGIAAPVVEVSGWNVPVQHVPAAPPKEPPHSSSSRNREAISGTQRLCISASCAKVTGSRLSPG